MSGKKVYFEAGTVSDGPANPCPTQALLHEDLAVKAPKTPTNLKFTERILYSTKSEIDAMDKIDKIDKIDKKN